MPRDREEVRRRLQQAALELYAEQGYEQTTAAGIAARAGVTERTFFRHFPDKREVLFGGQEQFIALLTGAVRDAPPELGPWDTLFRAFQSVEPLVAENRPISSALRRIIDASPALQERELTKIEAMIAALTTALTARGTPGPQAALAAQMGVAALKSASTSWQADPSGGPGNHLERAFQEVHALTSNSSRRLRRKPDAEAE